MKKRSNVQIILDALRCGSRSLDELTHALADAGKTASHQIVGDAIRNARRPNVAGAQIVSAGRCKYALVSEPPEGVRCVDGRFEIKTLHYHWQPAPNCRTSEEAVALRLKMIAGGV